MAEQLVLDLPVRRAFGRDDFFVSDANAQAVAAVEDWPRWPLAKLVLSGPAGAGKSHLAGIWADLTGAQVVRAATLPGRDLAALSETGAAVEDVPLAEADGEEALFHLHNLCAAAGRPLLLTGRGPSAGWGVALPDLASRIAAAMEVRLGAPDDVLLQAVVIKQFGDRQLAVKPGVLSYLLPRMERSFDFAGRLVDRLDARALARGAPVGRKLASEVLAELAAEAG